MAKLTDAQIKTELERKAAAGIKPTNAANQAQYDAIVAKQAQVQQPVQAPAQTPVGGPQLQQPNPIVSPVLPQYQNPMTNNTISYDEYVRQNQGTKPNYSGQYATMLEQQKAALEASYLASVESAKTEEKSAIAAQEQNKAGLDTTYNAQVGAINEQTYQALERQKALGQQRGIISSQQQVGLEAGIQGTATKQVAAAAQDRSTRIGEINSRIAQIKEMSLANQRQSALQRDSSIAKAQMEIGQAALNTQLQVDERMNAQNFQAYQAYLDKQFASQQAGQNRDFDLYKQQLSQQFQLSEAEKQRQAAAIEAAKGREHQTAEAVKERENQLLMQGLTFQQQNNMLALEQKYGKEMANLDFKNKKALAQFDQAFQEKIMKSEQNFKKEFFGLEAGLQMKIAGMNIASQEKLFGMEASLRKQMLSLEHANKLELVNLDREQQVSFFNLQSKEQRDVMALEAGYRKEFLNLETETQKKVIDYTKQYDREDMSTEIAVAQLSQSGILASIMPDLQKMKDDSVIKNIKGDWGLVGQSYANKFINDPGFLQYIPGFAKEREKLYKNYGDNLTTSQLNDLQKKFIVDIDRLINANKQYNPSTQTPYKGNNKK